MAIEKAITGGASPEHVAYTFSLSKRALERHIAEHLTASPAAETPTLPSVRAVPEAPPKPETVEGDGPATATAAAQIGELVKSIDVLVKAASTDAEASYSEKASLLRTSLQAINLLGKLTGELGASEATVAASPHWRRLRSEVIEALRPFPDALAAVHERLEVLEVAA